MNVNYRLLLPEESKIYRAIRLESLEKFPRAFGANYQEAVKIEKFRTESDIESQIPERFVLGAFMNKQLIGICTFIKDERNIGNIYQMYVKQEFQGKKIGLELLLNVITKAHERFNGIEIHLEVTPGNDKAHYLYKKAGFKDISRDSSGNTIMKYIE
ncbi:GNAT family N-acetyltransferase [Chryseobacterium sp. Tr-659]|uniref:GNAT family N-acetyltransferase n=1 Tax=Chryseobacterium sp. Tr-659 TaxID=2608340 RepID=UPI00141D7814|nr:GNAT family N-acetyltransferase [Chryseobacterium sp. Tr-659]NIF06204.1 GNAT family N-acetyltransferase [Chryseobacterium sp. Tr-659]